VERDDFEIEITNVAQITEYFRIFKVMLQIKEGRHQNEVRFLQSQVEAMKGQLESRGSSNSQSRQISSGR